MPKMSAMDAAVSILYDEGVRHIFGIPGAGILPFYQSLKNHGKIKHMVCRHEEGAIHMADGYARAIGTVGVCAATSGPGASNFITGLYTAQVDSIPLLALTGQNVRAQLGREAFQAVDIAEIAKPVTKKSYCVKEPAMMPWVFREAFKIMREGRPGPAAGAASSVASCTGSICRSGSLRVFARCTKAAADSAGSSPVM